LFDRLERGEVESSGDEDLIIGTRKGEEIAKKKEKKEKKGLPVEMSSQPSLANQTALSKKTNQK